MGYATRIIDVSFNIAKKVWTVNYLYPIYTGNYFIFGAILALIYAWIEQITTLKGESFRHTNLLSTLNTHLHPSGALFLPGKRALKFYRGTFSVIG